MYEKRFIFKHKSGKTKKTSRTFLKSFLVDYIKIYWNQIISELKEWQELQKAMAVSVA